MTQFTIFLRSAYNIYFVPKTETPPFQWFETPCRELITSSYDRRVKAVSDVISHITFAEAFTDPELEDPWLENAETVELIKTFLLHYLCERGHPPVPGRILEAFGLLETATDPLIRACLFMAVMTGSSMLPAQPRWTLKVCPAATMMSRLTTYTGDYYARLESGLPLHRCGR